MSLQHAWKQFDDWATNEFMASSVLDLASVPLEDLYVIVRKWYTSAGLVFAGALKSPKASKPSKSSKSVKAPKKIPVLLAFLNRDRVAPESSPPSLAVVEVFGTLLFRPEPMPWRPASAGMADMADSSEESVLHPAADTFEGRLRWAIQGVRMEAVAAFFIKCAKRYNKGADVDICQHSVGTEYAIEAVSRSGVQLVAFVNVFECLGAFLAKVVAGGKYDERDKACIVRPTDDVLPSGFLAGFVLGNLVPYSAATQPTEDTVRKLLAVTAEKKAAAEYLSTRDTDKISRDLSRWMHEVDVSSARRLFEGGAGTDTVASAGAGAGAGAGAEAGAGVEVGVEVGVGVGVGTGTGTATARGAGARGYQEYFYVDIICARGLRQVPRTGELLLKFLHSVADAVRAPVHLSSLMAVLKYYSREALGYAHRQTCDTPVVFRVPNEFQEELSKGKEDACPSDLADPAVFCMNKVVLETVYKLLLLGMGAGPCASEAVIKQIREPTSGKATDTIAQKVALIHKCALDGFRMIRCPRGTVPEASGVPVPEPGRADKAPALKVGKRKPTDLAEKKMPDRRKPRS
jgi:hypothetical protein